MTQRHDAPPEVYLIRVGGRLDPHWSAWLGGLSVTYGEADGRDTILYGPVIDQAALHGVLIKIRDMGVPLLSVQRVEPDRRRETDLRTSGPSAPIKTVRRERKGRPAQ